MPDHAFKLSASERQFLVQGIEEGLRADGRSRHDWRAFEVECGVSPQTNGSARLRCARANTDILVGVKLEISEPKPGQPDQGWAEFAVDCAAVASSSYQGRDVEDINHELAQVCARLFGASPALDFGALCIVPGAQCWVVHVEALVLETGGNLLDHICLAMKAALLDTRVPQVTVLDGVGAELPGEGAAGGEAGAAGGAGQRQAEIEVSDDPWQSRPLIAAEVADTVPVCITLSRVGRRTIADASLEEYAKRLHPLLFHLD